MIDRGIMELCGASPHEIDQWTLSEIATACIDPEQETQGENLGPDDWIAYLQWWESLTPEERLDAE